MLSENYLIFPLDGEMLISRLNNFCYGNVGLTFPSLTFNSVQWNLFLNECPQDGNHQINYLASLTWAEAKKNNLSPILKQNVTWYGQGLHDQKFGLCSWTYIICVFSDQTTLQQQFSTCMHIYQNYQFQNRTFWNLVQMVELGHWLGSHEMAPYLSTIKFFIPIIKDGLFLGPYSIMHGILADSRCFTIPC